jgi:hypothetical protein
MSASALADMLGQRRSIPVQAAALPAKERAAACLADANPATTASNKVSNTNVPIANFAMPVSQRQ